MRRQASEKKILSALQGGELDLVQHVEQVLSLVAETEPRVRALLPENGRRERLRAEAAGLLERFPEPASRPMLFGALLGVKDIFAVDGLPTRAGSKLPAEEFESEEASSVARLRGAGALILGKTVTTEFAFLAPGATTNPLDSRRTPGGSSSGSAAAVACGYVPLALGSQTVGSVIRPAAFCGVLGFKPSYGRIPSDGMLPFSESVDCPGLFACDLETLGLAAAVVVDGWSRAGSVPESLPVLGVPGDEYLGQVEPAARDAFESRLAALSDGGVGVRRTDALADFEEITRRHHALIAAEFAVAHAERFARWGPLFSGPTAGLYDRGGELGEAAIAEWRDSCRRVREVLESTMEKEGIDLWASPAATGEAPLGLDRTGDPRMNLVWTHAHMPVLTLPAGSGPTGMPLGLQLAARCGDDERLLAWARSCESLVSDGG